MKTDEPFGGGIEEGVGFGCRSLEGDGVVEDLREDIGHLLILGCGSDGGSNGGGG